MQANLQHRGANFQHEVTSSRCGDRPSRSFSPKLSPWELKVNNAEYDAQKQAIEPRGGDNADADLTRGNQLRLAVAEYRRALLVTYLFMWCGDRTKDVRRHAVNWDIGDVMLPHGGFQTMCWPQSQKTGFCKEATIGFNSGVGKIRQSKVASLCREDLRYHRPVLMHGLGSKARCKVKGTAAHGDPAEHCFTLFPWYWSGSKAGKFTRQKLELVLGVTERVLSGTLIKKFRCECDGDGVH